MHDYTPKNSNVTTIHINTAEDLQKYIQDGRSTPGTVQKNDATNKWEQIKGIMQDD